MKTTSVDNVFHSNRLEESEAERSSCCKEVDNCR